MIDKSSGQPTEGDFDIEPRLDKKGLICLGSVLPSKAAERENLVVQHNSFQTKYTRDICSTWCKYYHQTSKGSAKTLIP